MGVHKVGFDSNNYSRTPLFRTRLIRIPRYFEGRLNSLRFTLMFSVIYYHLFRTRLFRIPRYFEGRLNSLGFTLMFSVIYYQLFWTRLFQIPRYFEGRANSLRFTLMFSVIYYQLFRTRLFQIPAVSNSSFFPYTLNQPRYILFSNLSKTEHVHKSTAGNVLHVIRARVA